MPPTLKRILRAGPPAAVVLAGVGFLLAEVADLFLAANVPPRPVEVIDGADVGEPQPADPVSASVRRTLPLTMAAWGFGLVTAYELLRRLVKGPERKPGPVTPAAKVGDVDQLLREMMRKAEADRAGPEVATPPPVGTSHTRSAVEPGA